MNRYDITFQTWNKIADLYQERFMDFDLYNDSYDLFCEQIKKKRAEILEIGCGPGNITKYLLSKRPDFQIKAIDVAPNMIELAKRNNPMADFEIMDGRDISQLSQRFDAIVCGFCMPYLSKTDCEKLITDSFDLLQKNGLIYFSTIEGKENQSGFEKGSTGDACYVYYHEAAYLNECLVKSGFDLVQLMYKKYGVRDGKEQVHSIFIGRKK